MMILLDLSSVRRLLCSWLAVGEFGWTVMLSTAISSNVLHSVQQKSTVLCVTWLWSTCWLALERDSVHSSQFPTNSLKEKQVENVPEVLRPTVAMWNETQSLKMATLLLRGEGAGLYATTWRHQSRKWPIGPGRINTFFSLLFLISFLIFIIYFINNPHIHIVVTDVSISLSSSIENSNKFSFLIAWT